MTVDEAQNLLMKDFERKIMPSMIEKHPLWRPVQHDTVDIDRWRW